jgi:hypothetical protein
LFPTSIHHFHCCSHYRWHTDHIHHLASQTHNPSALTKQQSSLLSHLSWQNLPCRAQRHCPVMMEHTLSLESDLVANNASFRAWTHPCAVHVHHIQLTLRPPHPLPPPSPSPLSLSTLATFKSPFTSNPADVTHAFWFMPQAHATVASVSHMSQSSFSAPHHWSLLKTIYVIRYLAVLELTCSLSICFFISLSS